MPRSLQRIENYTGPGGEEFVDELAHFFIDCWHLRDWFKNDDSLPQTARMQIASAAKKMSILQYCADAANGRKHLKLDPK